MNTESVIISCNLIMNKYIVFDKRTDKGIMTHTYYILNLPKQYRYLLDCEGYREAYSIELNKELNEIVKSKKRNKK